jgi:hypothetical protein
MSGPQKNWEPNDFDHTILAPGPIIKNYQRFFSEDSAVVSGFLSIIDKDFDQQYARYNDHKIVAHNLAQKLVQIPETKIFIMAAADPFCLEQDQILDITTIISQKTNKKIVWLSGDCRHYKKTIPNSVYFPFWLAIREKFEQPPQQRSFRFSCLNRRPADHRDRVMSTLIKNNLVNFELDVLSIRYRGNSESFATHPDDWPNDHSIAHPAYQAHLNIVTETMPWERGIISEKTTKMFESETAGIIYNSPASIEVLRDLGFEIDYVTHASLDDITPIVNLLTQLQDPKDCESWYWQHIKHHQHNRQQFISSAWADHFEPWFKQQLANF